MHDRLMRMLYLPLLKEYWRLGQVYGDGEELMRNGFVGTWGDSGTAGGRQIVAGFRLIRGKIGVDGWEQCRVLFLRDNVIVVAYWTWNTRMRVGLSEDLPNDPLKDMADLRRWIGGLTRPNKEATP